MDASRAALTGFDRAIDGNASEGEHREDGLARRAAHGALRGTIAAMAMTGLREFTRHAGLLEEPPPESIVRQKLLRSPLRRVKAGRRRASVELAHWAYGAAGGAGFALLSERLRRRPSSGPLYGLLVWAAFELGLVPVLGLSRGRRPRTLDRVALALDHALYGFVLSETDGTREAPGDDSVRMGAGRG